MIGTIIKAIIFSILVLLACIGAAALVLMVMTIKDDRKLKERKNKSR